MMSWWVTRHEELCWRRGVRRLRTAGSDRKCVGGPPSLPTPASRPPAPSPALSLCRQTLDLHRSPPAGGPCWFTDREVPTQPLSPELPPSLAPAGPRLHHPPGTPPSPSSSPKVRCEAVKTLRPLHPNATCAHTAGRRGGTRCGQTSTEAALTGRARDLPL